MGFGRKKKKNGDADNSPEEVVQKPSKEKKVSNKKANKLSKVFSETVWDSALDKFRANSNFIVNREGETQYVGLLFDTNDIGGLDIKSAKGDEAKGSIIEAIRSGLISNYVTADLLEADCLVIIPDATTVATMDEYSYLTDISYIICYINSDAEILTETIGDTDDDFKVTFKQIADLVANDDNVSSILGGSSSFGGSSSLGDVSPTASAQFGEDDELEEIDDEESEVVDDDIPEWDGDEQTTPQQDDVNFNDLDDLSDVDDVEVEDFDDVVADDDDIPEWNDESNPAPAPAPEDDDTSYDDAYFDNAYDAENAEGDVEEGYEEYEEYEDEDADITQEDIQEYFVREFYSKDLGLEVSLAPFVMQFVQGNSYLPFEENRGEGWLNGYLSHIAIGANTFMERLHNSNIAKMQERYLRLMSMHCEKIETDLDPENPDSYYYKIQQHIDETKEKSIAELSDTVARKKAAINEEFEQRMQSAAEAAANDARQRYRNEHSFELEERLRLIEPDLKGVVDSEHRQAVAQMNEERRKEASKRLDMAVNETLSEISKMYLVLLRNERNEYARLENEMMKFIDSNRKDEKARIAALAEENRQKQKAEAVRKEYINKIEVLSTEFSVKKSQMQAELEQTQQENMTRLEEQRLDYERRYEEWKIKEGEMQSRIDELMDRCQNIDQIKKQEYDSRVNELEQERISWESKVDHLVAVHNKSNKIMVFLMVAGILAAIGIGYIFGEFMNASRNKSLVETVSPNIESDYDYDYGTDEGAGADTGAEANEKPEGEIDASENTDKADKK